MQADLVDLSTAYLMGWKTVRDFAEWLAGIDWDDPNVGPDVIRIAGRLELLTTEVLEGMRPEVEFWGEVSEFVSRETDSLYAEQGLTFDSNVADSSSDSVERPPEFMVPAVGASESWSISPLLVSE